MSVILIIFSSFFSQFLSFNVVDGIWQGIFRSGFAYYIQGLVMKEKGPVFVAAFNPVGLVIVVILGSFLLSEIMYLGRYFLCEHFVHNWTSFA